MKYLLICGAALLALSCGDDESTATGSEGGLCRIALDPCNDGLVCRDGECRPPNSDAEGRTFRLEVPIIETELEADGRDATPIRFRVIDVEQDEPYDGEIRLWVEPPGAGYLQNGLIELDGDGLGLTSFVACNKRDRDCPAFATIRFAAQNDPSEWFGSRTIKLNGGGQASFRPPAEDDPNGGMSGGGDPSEPGGGDPMGGGGNSGCDAADATLVLDFEGTEFTVPDAVMISYGQRSAELDDSGATLANGFEVGIRDRIEFSVLMDLLDPDDPNDEAGLSTAEGNIYPTGTFTQDDPIFGDFFGTSDEFDCTGRFDGENGSTISVTISKRQSDWEIGFNASDPNATCNDQPGRLTLRGCLGTPLN